MDNLGDKIIIRLDRVSKSYFTPEVETKVLKVLSLEIKRGDFVVVLGPSGCGKTTFLNLIGGLDKPTQGNIFVMGEEISNKDNNYLTKFRRKYLGFVFQFYNLIPTLTALENVELSLELLDLNPLEIHKRAREYLKKTGLEGKEDNFPSQLSGGEQQRVAIARALVKEPAIVLADEPTGNLDENTSHKIIQLALNLNKETGVTFVIASHNHRIAEVADQVIDAGIFLSSNY